VDKMTFFWVMIPVAIGVFYLGLYRNLFEKLAVILGASGRFIPWERLTLGAFLQAFQDEVLAQRRIRQRSQVAWLRHMLLFWGFMVLFLFDILTALFTKYLQLLVSLPTFLEGGVGHTVLKFGLNTSGAILLVAIVFALIRGTMVAGTPEARFNDVPGLVMLFLVVASGFVTEAVRYAALPATPAMAFSGLGALLAAPLRGAELPWASLYDGLWVLHALSAGVFFAYIGWTRMIHVIAAPLGRLFYAQEALRDAKVLTVLEGLTATAARPAAVPDRPTAGWGRVRRWAVWTFLVSELGLVAASTAYVGVFTREFALVVGATAATTAVYLAYVLSRPAPAPTGKLPQLQERWYWF